MFQKNMRSVPKPGGSLEKFHQITRILGLWSTNSRRSDRITSCEAGPQLHVRMHVDYIALHCIYLHICTCTCIYIYIYIYRCIYIYMCVCVHMCTCTSLGRKFFLARCFKTEQFISLCGSTFCESAWPAWCLKVTNVVGGPSTQVESSYVETSVVGVYGKGCWKAQEEKTVVLATCIYMYIYIYACVHIYIYIHT